MCQDPFQLRQDLYPISNGYFKRTDCHPSYDMHTISDSVCSAYMLPRISLSCLTGSEYNERMNSEGYQRGHMPRSFKLPSDMNTHLVQCNNGQQKGGQVSQSYDTIIYSDAICSLNTLYVTVFVTTPSQSSKLAIVGYNCRIQCRGDTCYFCFTYMSV